MAQKDICRSLAELNNLIHRQIIKEYASKEDNENPHSMSQSGSCIIAYLNDHKDTDVYGRDLEQEFMVRRSTMSKVLTLLEQKGLIKRVDVNYDRRLKKIELTEKAQLYADKIISHRTRLENTLTQGVGEEELNAFRLTLEKLKQNMSKEEIQ